MVIPYQTTKFKPANVFAGAIWGPTTKFNIIIVYRIAGNFGEVFNLANWRFCGKSPNLNVANIISYTTTLYGSARDRQCIWMTDLPNLMLTKVSRYVVSLLSIPQNDNEINSVHPCGNTGDPLVNVVGFFSLHNFCFKFVLRVPMLTYS